MVKGGKPLSTPMVFVMVVVLFCCCDGGRGDDGAWALPGRVAFAVDGGDGARRRASNRLLHFVFKTRASYEIATALTLTPPRDRGGVRVREGACLLCRVQQLLVVRSPACCSGSTGAPAVPSCAGWSAASPFFPSSILFFLLSTSASTDFSINKDWPTPAYPPHIARMHCRGVPDYASAM